MKKAIHFSLITVLFAALVLSACDSQLAPSQPISHATEEPESVTNDFTLVKACIGMQGDDSNSLLRQQGFSEEETNMYYRKYNKTENGITKEVHISAPTYAAMMV